MTAADRRRLLDQISLIRASLADAQLEHQAGELDDASFAEITERDTTRLAELEADLAELPEEIEDTSPSPAEPAVAEVEDGAVEPPARRGRRLWLLIVGLVLIALGASVLLANVLSRTTAQPTSTQAQVHALLQAADVKVAKGDVAGGLATYRQVLGLDPTQPQALAESGWLTFEAGVAARSATLIARGEAEVKASIQAAPNYYASRLYLGVIELLANQDPAAAMVQFNQFEALSPPARWRTTAQPYIDKAKAALASTTTTTPGG